MLEKIIIEDLCKSFPPKKVLEHLSFSILPGEITAVMAPSGVGKTTLLSILMGLESPDSGTIRGLNGTRLSAVFQEDRLCDNLSPLSNIRLVTGPSCEKGTILSALCDVGLEECIFQPARELSGGQRRRVALLRALLADWDLLLLDEPFKGLDSETRQMVMDYVLACFHRSSGRAVVLVTHDETEASYMADRVLTLPSHSSLI